MGNEVTLHTSHLGSSSLPRALLVVSLVTLVLVLCRHDGGGRVVMVQLEGQDTREMQELIKEQQEELHYLRRHPKVIYRCLEDEPRIWYPKRASDDLTQIMMATSDGCGDRLDAVMIVHTSANHFVRRNLFREAYTDETTTEPYRLKVVFLVGHVHDAKLQIELEIENRQYGDTVVGSFYDSYENLTLKAVMGYRWLSQNCKDVPLLIKIDDDVLIDVPRFFASYRHHINPDKHQKSIFCNVWEKAKVQRTGKWKIEKGLFRNDSYSFPYCSGYFVIVTPDLIQSMYNSGKEIDFFWVDDVFLYGMVPANITNVSFKDIGDYHGGMKVITEKSQTYEKCMEDKGLDCKTWGVLTKGDDHFKKLYANLRSLYDKQNNTNSETNNDAKAKS